MTVAVDGLRVWDAANGEPISPLLRQQSETPDQRGAAGSSAPWSVPFRADERPVADLLRVVEVLSAQRVADAGQVVPLDRAELTRAWQDVRKKYGKDFMASRDRLAAWHGRGRGSANRRQLWSGALRHLDYLIIAKPSSSLHARRGRANAELRHWEAAKADYTKAIGNDGDRWDLWAGRAAAQAALGRWQEAIKDYSKAIEQKGDRAELWTARGRLEAEHADWRKAAADLGKAIHLGEQDATVWRQHILALLASGDDANYRRWCERLVQHFGHDKDEAVLQNVVWTCALSDGAVRDWKPLLQRVEQALAANPRSAEPRRQLAMLLYRAGQFDAAVKRLQDMRTVSRFHPQARDWLVMALAAQRLGRGEDAKKWLDKAEQIRRDNTEDKNESWEDRFVYIALHLEAETLIKGDKR